MFKRLNGRTTPQPRLQRSKSNPNNPQKYTFQPLPESTLIGLYHDNVLHYALDDRVLLPTAQTNGGQALLLESSHLPTLTQGKNSHGVVDELVRFYEDCLADKVVPLNEPINSKVGSRSWSNLEVTHVAIGEHGVMTLRNKFRNLVLAVEEFSPITAVTYPELMTPIIDALGGWDTTRGLEFTKVEKQTYEGLICSLNGIPLVICEQSDYMFRGRVLKNYDLLPTHRDKVRYGSPLSCAARNGNLVSGMLSPTLVGSMFPSQWRETVERGVYDFMWHAPVMPVPVPYKAQDHLWWHVEPSGMSLTVSLESDPTVRVVLRNAEGVDRPLLLAYFECSGTVVDVLDPQVGLVSYVERCLAAVLNPYETVLVGGELVEILQGAARSVRHTL